jgi:hypothetical protein
MEKFLPLNVQNFEEMIAGNFIYVDKTKYIYEMVRIPQAYYFLSRPRRFGKSLTVSTLKFLFEGRRELFKYLWIEKSDWKWAYHPVVAIDFNQISFDTPENLKLGLHSMLDDYANDFSIRLEQQFLIEKFVELIIKIGEKFDNNVVILVDEYDKPIVEFLGKGEDYLKIAKANRDILIQFFGVLKSSDVSAALRMAYITGVSKFSLANIYSGLNNLNDLTMQDAFSTILGFTEDELHLYFDDNIKNIANELKTPSTEIYRRIQDWYNGYCFASKDVNVYNPFSIINLLKFKEFKNYWAETGTPSLLVNLIKEKKYPIPDMEKLELSELRFSSYDLDRLSLEPLLLQTGYLTIQDVRENIYTLNYPNQEVKVSFLSYLYDQIVETPSTAIKEQFTRLHEYLNQNEINRFIDTVNAILSSIPYQHIYDQDEHYYHTVFYLMLSASGAQVHTEVLTSMGRIDLEVYFDDKIYIIELKCNQAADKAIEQIKQKKYFEKHKDSGKKILLMGINFDTEQRRIVDWKIENI